MKQRTEKYPSCKYLRHHDDKVQVSSFKDPMGLQVSFRNMNKSVLIGQALLAVSQLSLQLCDLYGSLIDAWYDWLPVVSAMVQTGSFQTLAAGPQLHTRKFSQQPCTQQVHHSLVLHTTGPSFLSPVSTDSSFLGPAHNIPVISQFGSIDSSYLSVAYNESITPQPSSQQINQSLALLKIGTSFITSAHHRSIIPYPCSQWIHHALALPK